MFGVFRVKNHDFTQKNHIFSNFRGTRAGCAAPSPPLESAPGYTARALVHSWFLVRLPLVLLTL